MNTTDFNWDLLRLTGSDLIPISRIQNENFKNEAYSQYPKTYLSESEVRKHTKDRLPKNYRGIVCVREMIVIAYLLYIWNDATDTVSIQEIGSQGWCKKCTPSLLFDFLITCDPDVSLAISTQSLQNIYLPLEDHTEDWHLIQAIRSQQDKTGIGYFQDISQDQTKRICRPPTIMELS